MLMFRTTYNIRDILKKIVNIFVKYFYDWKHFSFEIAHYNFWCEYPFISILPHRCGDAVKRKKFQLIYSFLDNKYSNFIDEYKTKKIES